MLLKWLVFYLNMPILTRIFPFNLFSFLPQRKCQNLPKNKKEHFSIFLLSQFLPLNHTHFLFSFIRIIKNCLNYLFCIKYRCFHEFSMKKFSYYISSKNNYCRYKKVPLLTTPITNAKIFLSLTYLLEVLLRKCILSKPYVGWIRRKTYVAKQIFPANRTIYFPLLLKTIYCLKLHNTIC